MLVLQHATGTLRIMRKELPRPQELEPRHPSTSRLPLFKATLGVLGDGRTPPICDDGSCVSVYDNEGGQYLHSERFCRLGSGMFRLEGDSEEALSGRKLAHFCLTVRTDKTRFFF